MNKNRLRYGGGLLLIGLTLSACMSDSQGTQHIEDLARPVEWQDVCVDAATGQDNGIPSQSGLASSCPPASPGSWNQIQHRPFE